jgi:hypothetical protein
MRLLASALAATALLAGCGDEQSPPAGAPAASETNSLVLTRVDGSTADLDRLSVTCRPGDAASGEDAARTYLLIESPRRVKGGKLAEPYVMVRVPVDDVAAGAVLELPVADAEGVVFVGDETGIEASSSGEDGSGALTIEKASCEPEPTIALTIDATLDSEYFDGDPAELSGSYASKS